MICDQIPTRLFADEWPVQAFAPGVKAHINKKKRKDPDIQNEEGKLKWKKASVSLNSS